MTYLYKWYIIYIDDIKLHLYFVEICHKVTSENERCIYMQELIDYLYDMNVHADIKIEELAEDIISMVGMMLRPSDDLIQ